MIYAVAVTSALAWTASTLPMHAAVRTASPTMMADRGFLMAGNWKMNTVLEEAKSLAADVAKATESAAADVDVAVCVPFPFLAPVSDVLKDSKVGLGAQDCYYEDSGAFTAAVSTSMLKSVGSEYVLTGHSERRATFGDSDEDVNKKTLKVLAEGLKCILCIGELKEERESGETFAVCDTQLTAGLKGVSAEMMKDIVIAYEPVWASTCHARRCHTRRTRSRAAVAAASPPRTHQRPFPADMCLVRRSALWQSALA